MAIVQNEVNNYYKIIFEETGVYNGFVYVTVKGYATENDRLKEKERANAFELFNNSVENLLTQMQNDLESDYNEYKADFVERIERTHYIIKHNSVLVNDQQPTPFVMDKDVKKILLQLGLDDNFYLDPVRMIIVAKINCGVYNGEELTPEFYYSRLKSVILNAIDK